MTATKSGYIEQARLRVRSVRYKDGRGELRLLRPPRRAYHDDLIANLRELCSEFESDPEYAGKLAGYAITAWYVDKRLRTTRIKFAPDSNLFAGDLPDYVKGAVGMQVYGDAALYLSDKD